jgi:galactokinase
VRVSRIEPFWARYVAGVVATLRPTTGFQGKVTTTVPVGAGLSSSAALEIALALALGFQGTTEDLARACQRAEQLATGVPTGLLDQLASANGREGFAMMLDCRDLSISYVPIPSEVEVVVVHSGQGRQLAASGYTERVEQCRAAEAAIGPLRDATLDDVARIDDGVVASRARHVVTENQRVRDFGAAMADGNFGIAGDLMTDSHRSLRDDYASSHPTVDALVRRLVSRPGVYGARVTGGGFGGCVVALTRPGALAAEGWHVKPSAGARLL